MSSLPIAEHALGKFPTIFVRLKGRGPNVMEFNALIDPGSEYCILSKVDAYMLGYTETASDDPITQANNTFTFSSYMGYTKANFIEMEQVQLGAMSFEKVGFLTLDIPQVTRFDVVLGRSLLQFINLELDYPLGQMSIERKGRMES